MKYFSVYLLATLFTVNCGHILPRNPDFVAVGCVVEAVEFQGAAVAYRRLCGITWTRLVRVDYWKIPWHLIPWEHSGHAMCVFRLKNGDIWAYDTLNGSRSLGTRKKDITSIAKAIHKNDRRCWGAEFID